MATDKKSDHFTAAQHYRDIDGNMRNFTFIDHDKKTKINTTVNIDESQVNKDLKEFRLRLVDKILNLPAAACPEMFSDFKVRKETSIGWNETMLKDEGTPLNQLISIHTLTTNKVDLATKGFL